MICECVVGADLAPLLIPSEDKYNPTGLLGLGSWDIPTGKLCGHLQVDFPQPMAAE